MAGISRQARAGEFRGSAAEERDDWSAAMGRIVVGTDGSTTNLSLTSILVRVGRVILTYSYSWDADASQASPWLECALRPAPWSDQPLTPASGPLP